MVLLNILSTTIPYSWFRGIALALLGSLLSWVSVFGWSIWRGTVWSGFGNFLEFNPSKSQSDFLYRENWQNREEAKCALSYIKKNYSECATIFDYSFNLASTDSVFVWNAMHPPANFISIPSTFRREFLTKTANTIKRSGWLIVQKDYYLTSDFLSDFDSVYIKTQELKFGKYHAIRYVPR